MLRRRLTRKLPKCYTLLEISRRFYFNPLLDTIQFINVLIGQVLGFVQILYSRHLSFITIILYRYCILMIVCSIRKLKSLSIYVSMCVYVPSLIHYNCSLKYVLFSDCCHPRVCTEVVHCLCTRCPGQGENESVLLLHHHQ